MSNPRYLAISALALFALTQLTSATPATASPASGLATSESVARQSLIAKAGYGYCWRWNAICRDRWVGGWRYHRCMRAHGC